MKKHLEDLGFHVGGQVSVINSLGENLIVKVKESRVAVSDPLDASKPAGSSDQRSGAVMCASCKNSGMNTVSGKWKDGK